MPRNLSSSHLKLHNEEPRSTVAGDGREPAFDLPKLLNAFSQATGWTPRPARMTPHQRGLLEEEEQPTLPLRKRMRLVSSVPMDGLLDAELDTLGVTSEADAWQLFEQIDALIQRVNECEKAIELQEAQLATAIGVSVRTDEAQVLTSRLQESLERAAQQTGSDAAAVYLLDDTTSELKMRSNYGLPTSALSEPARSLRGALADLEALMGNAVLIENTELAPEWNCPGEFAAALCLPIGSPTMPQGTLWLWSDHVRDFGSHDIDIAKAAAEKILVDIERCVLADEVLKGRSTARQLEAASLTQASRLPSLQRLHPDYEIAGWTFQGQELGGNFHTWTINQQKSICAALGAAHLTGVPGALVASSVQTLVDTYWNSRHKPAQVLRKANDILFDSEDGDWRSSLCYLKLHPASGTTELAMAGDMQTFVITSRGARVVGGTPTLLAEQADTRFFNEQIYLEGGELLVIASGDVLRGAEHGGLSQDAFLDSLRTLYDERVEDISIHLARMLPMPETDQPQLKDRSLIILRRRF